MTEYEHGDNVQIDVRDNPHSFGLGMMLYRIGPEGRVDSIAEPLTFTKIDKSGPRCFLWRATLTLERDVTQKLMDALWQHGVRPSSEGTEGQFAAQNAHLQDMRRIAFAALKTADVTVREDVDGSGVRGR